MLMCMLTYSLLLSSRLVLHCSHYDTIPYIASSYPSISIAIHTYHPDTVLASQMSDIRAAVEEARCNALKKGFTEDDVRSFNDVEYAEFCTEMGWSALLSKMVRNRLGQTRGRVDVPVHVDAASCLTNALLESAQKKAAKYDEAELHAFHNDKTFEDTVKALKPTVLSSVLDRFPNGVSQVCFVMDATGSMGPYFEEVRRNIVSTAKKITDSFGIEVRFALVEYRDYDDGNRIEKHVFTTAHVLEEKLSKVCVSGGGDTAEDCFGGLHAALTELLWDSKSRLIFWIGDAPNHGEKYNGGCNDNYAHEKLKIDGLDIATLAEQFGVNIMFNRLTSDTDKMINVMKKEFATVGANLNMSNGSDLSATILNTLTQTATGTCVNPQNYGAIITYAVVPEAAYEKTTKCAKVFTFQQAFTQFERVDPVRAMLSCEPPFNEECRDVCMSEAPFARGELRYAYKCKISPSRKKYYAKWLKDGICVAKTPAREKATISKTQVYMQNICRFLAREFTAHLTEAMPLSNAYRRVAYVPVQLMRLKNEFWALEPYIDGEFLKFNNNYGSVMKDLLPQHPIPQAFSHFTYEYSYGTLMVTDIQGIVTADEYIFTDPAIHTKEGVSVTEKLCDPTTNMGSEGMFRFFKSHVCNDFCKRLMLPDRSEVLDAEPSCMGCTSMSVRGNHQDYDK